jgi:pilus assembly protein CpaF
MFGKRGDTFGQSGTSPLPPRGLDPPASSHAAGANIPDLDVKAAGSSPQAGAQGKTKVKEASRKSDSYYDIKSTIFNALIDAIDLTQLGQLDRDSARDEIRDIVNEIIALKDVAMSIAEQEELLEDICNDVLGYGPLEPLLARDEIADIMVNGASLCFIEVDGKVSRRTFGFATIHSCSTSASVSSARSGAGSMNRARSATRACLTDPASTSSCRRWPSTVLP